MKAVGGPQKLRFTIHSSSGEDTDYPVRELLYHSPQTRGWQSLRFCKYPQELVLRLERPSKVQQIQILAHEFKIPTKIEVFVGFSEGQSGPDGAAAAASGSMRRLGYLSFDSNERSNFQARELKSVHVTVDAELVRLVIHRCHVNKMNIYNQVGIIALNLIGEPLSAAPEGPPGFLDTDGPTSHELTYYNKAAGDLADLQLDVHVDSTTAARIKELARAKEAAVAAEDYDEAKRLKAAIERLKVVGGKVAQLEARKRLAVEREDYDLAKALKADIEKLRSAGEAAALASPPGAQQPHRTTVTAGLAGRPPQPLYEEASEGGEGMATQQSGAVGLAAGYDAERPAAGAEGSGGYAAEYNNTLHTYQAYEDRPAVAKASFGGRPLSAGSEAGAEADVQELDDESLIRADPSKVSAAVMFGSAGTGRSGGGSKKSLLTVGGPGGLRTSAGPGSLGAAAAAAGPAAAAADDVCGAAAPGGWPSDLPAPEPLAAVSASEAGPVLDVAGEFVAAAFFSRSWQLRDAAAAWLADLTRNGRLTGGGPDRRELARGLVRLAVKGLKDKVPQVCNSCLSLLQALLAALASSGSGRDVCQAVETALPVLMERLSDNNSRLRDNAREALVALAQEPEGCSALRAQTSQLCKLPRNQTAWRPVLAMLQLLQELVPLLGIAASGAAARTTTADSNGGFDLHELMSYVGAAFGSANADVRAAALQVAVLAGQSAGAVPVRRLLPQGMNPKMREQVEQALGLDTSQQAAAAQPSPAPRANKSAGGAGGAKSSAKPVSSGHPNRQAAAAAGTPRQQPHKQQQQPRQQQHNPPAHEQQQVLAGLEAEDPAPFVAELTAREHQYGPNHPAVAESCSNLAILYNQKGDYGAALPLYERALAIYEANYGPNHQEVAHTLTDLAVLHLEQGHDAVGRPLLERALIIQEAALGPDHPDVVAIRDVLNSE